MNVLETIENLEKSKEFGSWKKGHKDSYLVHCFRMLDEANKNIWQIGYFNPDSNLISVFVVNEKISKNEDAEVLKEQEKLVQPLKTKDIKILEEDALQKAKETTNANYKGTVVFKSFMILQNLEKFGQVWNITFVTQRFQTINVKIDAKTGEVKVHNMASLIQE
jgi:hypothetical protein